MDRTFIFASADRVEEAARVVAASPETVDIVITSPSGPAVEAGARMVGGRWVQVVEEPLLAARAEAEDDEAVLERLVQALRTLPAYAGRAPLVIFEALDVLGAGVFVLDEAGVERLAEDLERALPIA
jgi:hypothetical protein